MQTTIYLSMAKSWNYREYIVQQQQHQSCYGRAVVNTYSDTGEIENLKSDGQTTGQGAGAGRGHER